jgi:hypothetical protein
MARLHVEISMVDDQGRTRLEYVRDEPTRIDVDADPIFVAGRLQHLLSCAMESLHEQALKIEERELHG